MSLLLKCRNAKRSDGRQENHISHFAILNAVVFAVNCSTKSSLPSFPKYQLYSFFSLFSLSCKVTVRLSINGKLCQLNAEAEKRSSLRDELHLLWSCERRPYFCFYLYLDTEGRLTLSIMESGKLLPFKVEQSLNAPVHSRHILQN